MKTTKQFVEGLQLLLNLGETDMCAHHDVIYVGASDYSFSDTNGYQVYSQELIDKMRELGFHIEEESFAYFT